MREAVDVLSRQRRADPEDPEAERRWLAAQRRAGKRPDLTTWPIWTSTSGKRHLITWRCLVEGKLACGKTFRIPVKGRRKLNNYDEDGLPMIDRKLSKDAARALYEKACVSCASTYAADYIRGGFFLNHGNSHDKHIGKVPPDIVKRYGETPCWFSQVHRHLTDEEKEAAKTQTDKDTIGDEEWYVHTCYEENAPLYVGEHDEDYDEE